MMALETSFLLSYGPALIDNGFNIVPIAAGKKYPAGLSNWQQTVATKQDVKDWSKQFPGVGVLAAHNPGVDIDVRDPSVSEEMVRFVTDLLGETVQRIGDAPKTLMVFRSEEPFTKVMSNKYSDIFGLEHQIEILGDGQQFVAFADHPDTKQPYTWVDGKDLSQVKYEDLPLITQDDAIKIVEHFESVVPDYWELVSKGQTEVKEVDEFTALENIKSKIDVSDIEIKKALRSVSPEEYDTWTRVGMGLFHQFDGGVDGFNMWDEWSQGSDKYNPREIGFKWDSFKADQSKNPVTAASILKMAKDEGKTKTLSGFGLIHASDIMAKLKPIPWLIRGVVEQDSTGLIFGDPANFKSFITIDMACHVAAGKEWHGHEVNQGPVIYVAGEGHNGFARRLAAWQLEHPDFPISEMPIYFSQKAAGFLDMLEAQKVTDCIDEIVDGEGVAPSMIVIDTLARNFGAGDENSTSDMNTFVNHIDGFLRAKYNCVVLIVHHTGKADKSNARGSSALKGAIDFEYHLDRPEENQEDMTVQMINSKMKDAPQPQPIWFQGEEKIVGNFDEEVTSLAFKQIPAPDKTPASSKLKGHQSGLYEFTKREVEFSGCIERSELRKRAVESGVCRDATHFRKIFNELTKKGLLEEKDKEISVLDEFF